MLFSFFRRYFCDLKHQIFIVVLLSGSLPPLFFSTAASLYNDYFEYYDTGVISSGSFLNNIVSINKAHEGVKSILWIAGTQEVSAVGTGSQDFWVYWPAGLNAENRYNLRTDIEGYILILDFQNYVGAPYRLVVSQNGGPIGFHAASNFIDQWRHIWIEWRSSDKKVRYKIDGIIDWSDWSLTTTDWGTGANRFSQDIAGGGLYFDTFGEMVYGYSILIEPTYPIDCQFTTTTSPLSFTATGKITIPTENEFYWNKFYVWAFDLYNAIAYNASTTFSPSLKAGDTENYSIPLSLPDGAYKISYSIDGYHPTEMYGTIDTHYCLTTGIGTQTYIPALIIPEFPEFEPEVCSEYALLERLVCEIKNFIKNLVYPNTSKINELKTNISTFQTKIPLNYLSASKNFFTNTQNGLATTTPSMSIWDSATTSINFDFLTASNQIAGQNFTLKDIFKFFSSIILVLILTFWSLDFKNRIFK